MLSSKKDKPSILIIGQIPPPYGGQSIAISYLINTKWDGIKIFHLKMNYSTKFEEVGRFKIRKIVELFRIVFKTFFMILRYSISVVYYPPGSNLASVLRDIVTLIFIRPISKKIIFEFHAGGLCEFLQNRSTLLQWLASKAFYYPDIAIQKASFLPESKLVKAKKEFVIPYGIVDQYARYNVVRTEIKNVPTILFVGVIREDKGITILLTAAKKMKENNVKFNLVFIGEYVSGQYKEFLSGFVNKANLQGLVEFLGPKIDDEKWLFFKNADIFCYPSYFESEATPIAVIEAMMFALPVVASSWRGLSELVINNSTGFLVPPQDPDTLSDRLQTLLQSPDLRLRFGTKGREMFLQNYTIEKYLEQMGNVFREAVSG